MIRPRRLRDPASGRPLSESHPPAGLAGLDLGPLAALLLALLAAWPLLTRPGLPTTTDAELHIYRAAQVLRAWAGGLAYPRWAPDLAFGYGYPVFNYYAPLAYHVSAAYGLFLGGAVAGVKFTLVASLALGAVGMYAFARLVWGGPGALTAAAAFTLAPYVAYLNPVARGAAPEALAVGLSPWLFWAFTRLWRRPTAARLALAAFSLAALLLAHNLLSLVFAGLLAGWLAWNWLAAPEHRPALPRAAAALLAGAGLAAFFWLPAILERQAVQYQRAFAFVQDPRNRLRFVPAGELLAPVVAADLAEPAAADWRFRLGLPQWGLAALGLLALFQRRAERPWLGFFALMAGLCLGLALPAAEPLWRPAASGTDGLPALLYLQLPWRLLGPAAFALAMLAGGAVAVNPWLRPSLAAAGAVAACALAAWPLLDPLPWPDFGPVTPERVRLYEAGGGIGTTAQNEFLPAAVAEMPAPPADPADKIERAGLPAGAAADLVEARPDGWRLRVDASAGLTLTLRAFAFPGWQAEVDGVPVAITPSVPHGLITLPVPAPAAAPGAGSAHTVTVRFGETPARTAGWAVSALTLAGLAGALVLRRPAPTAGLEPDLGWSAQRIWPLLAGLGLLLGARWAADQLRPVAEPAPALARFEGQLALLAFELPEAVARPGASVPLSLTWQATGAVPGDYSVFVHVLDADGRLAGQSDKMTPLPEFPTSRWPPGRRQADAHQLTLQPDIAPGLYALRVGLWDRLSGARLRVLDAAGRPGDQDGFTLAATLMVQP
ncbi:MAG: hypothetical protein JNK29_02950 [Anaerolineales bacterium]|nr:hypothetical protein [Anaerolineales bacterium]